MHEVSQSAEPRIPSGELASQLGALPVATARQSAEHVASEMSQLDSLLRSSEVLDGNYELVEVGDAGYIVRLTDHPAELGNDWVFSDLDDTLVAYTQAKGTRLRAYQQYLADSGIDLRPVEAEGLLEATDAFARWDELGTEMYHLDAHKAALSWATASLRNLGTEEREAALGQIRAGLDRVKSGHGAHDGGPFRIDEHGRPVINRDAPQEDIDAVFETMVRPGRYGDALDSMIELANEPNDEHRVNLGVFTYGGPAFQLEKTLDLLRTQAESGQPLNLSQIWLAKVPKGEFVQELLSVMPASLEQELFGGSPHAMMLVDDSVKELERMLQQNQAIAERYHVVFTALRSLRLGTKAEHQSWPQKVYGEYDPGRGVFPAESVHFSLAQHIRMGLSIQTRELLRAQWVDPRTSPYTYHRLTRRYDGYVDDILANWPPDEHTIRYTWGKYNHQYDKSKFANPTR